MPSTNPLYSKIPIKTKPQPDLDLAVGAGSGGDPAAPEFPMLESGKSNCGQRLAADVDRNNLLIFA
jgi:hypothetical protein